MIGVDIGLNVASVTVLNSEGEFVETVVIKGKGREGHTEDDDWNRIRKVADMICAQVRKLAFRWDVPREVAIEAPVYSWGRRNPKVFAKSVMLFSVIRLDLQDDGMEIHVVNNKAAKRIAGGGNYDKNQMVNAFKKKAKFFRPFNINAQPKYAQETIADSFFIALEGLRREG